MKMLVLSAIVLFSAFTSVGQEKKRAASQPPVITKGYYSIGNNAQKLLPRTEPVLETEATANQQAPAKGYYGVGKNRKRMAAQTTIKPSNRKPVITKGYYSIGNNAEKLKN